jgi:hypothetical protein
MEILGCSPLELARLRRIGILKGYPKKGSPSMRYRLGDVEKLRSGLGLEEST